MGMEAEQLQEEKDRLAKIKASLKDDDLQKIIDTTAELKQLQAAEDSLEDRLTIPSLDLSDIKREVTEYPIDVKENEAGTGVTVVRHELGSTSSIVYATLNVDVSSLPLKDVTLLPLFTRIMTETGAGATGEHFVTKISIGGKATSDKADELFSIFDLVLRDAKLDSQAKIIEMLREAKSSKESSVQGSGHAVANSRIKSRYNVISYIGEKMNGISSLDEVKALLDQAENDFPALLARLEGLRETILNANTCRDGMILDITGDAAVLEKIEPSVEKFLNELPGDSGGSAGKLQEF